MANDQPSHPARRMRHPCPDILLRIACFDAYAVAAENVEAGAFRRALKLQYPQVRYRKSPVYEALRVSCYTDDTERAIANARALLEPVEPGQEPTVLNFANLYVDEFKRSGRRRGYARGYQALLDARDMNFGRDLLARLKPTSCRNGAMMGAGVLGVLPDEAAVLRVATTQAAVTHNTSCGIFSARVAALATHYALYEDAPLTKLPTYLLDRQAVLTASADGEIDCGHRPLIQEALSQPWPLDQPVVESEGYPIGLATVRAVVAIAAGQPSLISAMDLCLDMGGDTDTVAAIVACVKAPRCREEVLPAFLERDLERSDPWTGASRLLQLGAALMDAYA